MSYLCRLVGSWTWTGEHHQVRHAIQVYFIVLYFILFYRVRKYTACSTLYRGKSSSWPHHIRSGGPVFLSVCLTQLVCYCNQWLAKQQTIFIRFPIGTSYLNFCMKHSSIFKLESVVCTSGGLNSEFSSRYILNRFTLLMDFTALHTENIELFVEDQAFLRSYDSALRPPTPPLSRLQLVSLSQSSCVSPIELTDRRMGGRGAKSYDSEKAALSIKHSILLTSFIHVH